MTDRKQANKQKERKTDVVGSNKRVERLDDDEVHDRGSSGGREGILWLITQSLQQNGSSSQQGSVRFAHVESSLLEAINDTPGDIGQSALQLLRAASVPERSGL